jgi:hypothetical protein
MLFEQADLREYTYQIEHPLNWFLQHYSFTHPGAPLRLDDLLEGFLAQEI